MSYQTIVVRHGADWCIECAAHDGNMFADAHGQACAEYGPQNVRIITTPTDDQRTIETHVLRMNGPRLVEITVKGGDPDNHAGTGGDAIYRLPRS